MVNLAVRLRRARERRGLSQSGLARELGISQAQYNRYERGRQVPGFEMAARIAAALGVSLDWLATGLGDGPRCEALQ